jgi:hypothetical protein
MPDLVLPINMKGRRWAVGEKHGDVFEDDEDFDGFTLVIELRSAAEARDIVRAMLAADADWPPARETRADDETPCEGCAP